MQKCCLFFLCENIEHYITDIESKQLSAEKRTEHIGSVTGQALFYAHIDDALLIS